MTSNITSNLNYAVIAFLVALAMVIVALFTVPTHTQALNMADAGAGGGVTSAPTPAPRPPQCVNGNYQLPRPAVSGSSSSSSSSSSGGSSSGSSGGSTSSSSSSSGSSSGNPSCPLSQYPCSSSGGSSGVSGTGNKCSSSERIIDGSCCPKQYATRSTKTNSKGGTVWKCDLPKVKNCKLDGVTVKHGDSKRFFSTKTVAYDDKCSEYRVNRKCINGNLSGQNKYKYSSCKRDNAPSQSDISVTAVPSVVAYEGDATISWNGGNSDSCTVTATNFSKSGVTGSDVAYDITEERTYTLECSLDAQTKTAETTVKVVPRWNEF